MRVHQDGRQSFNRSVDFTKAGHRNGTALQATLETVTVQSAIDVPLRIVRHVYTDSMVSCAPLPADMCACVITDRHWLGENLLCLLSNAAKYSDGGAIDVAVSLRPPAVAGASCDGDGVSAADRVGESVPAAAEVTLSARHRDNQSRLRVTVADRGIGIPADLHAHLFQPFGRAQRMAGGTGLGLFRRVVLDADNHQPPSIAKYL